MLKALSLYGAINGKFAKILCEAASRESPQNDNEESCEDNATTTTFVNDNNGLLDEKPDCDRAKSNYWML